MIINLTQHAATPEQAGVVDLPEQRQKALQNYLTCNTLPDRAEIVERCGYIAALASGWDAALIGGAPWMMAELERALRAVDVEPVYAFSVRESTEVTDASGSVRKVSAFRHVGFIDACVGE
jgi:hypothetical protein